MVYFTRKGRKQAIACDKWDSIRDNLQAVAKTIEACAGLDVGGRGDGQPFEGFTQSQRRQPVKIAIRPLQMPRPNRPGPRSTNTPTTSELYRGNQPLLAGRQVPNYRRSVAESGLPSWAVNQNTDGSTDTACFLDQLSTSRSRAT